MLWDHYVCELLMRDKIATWLGEAERDRTARIANGRRAPAAADRPAPPAAPNAGAVRRSPWVRLGAQLASSLRLW